jgi:hypothetical protein
VFCDIFTKDTWKPMETRGNYQYEGFRGFPYQWVIFFHTNGFPQWVIFFFFKAVSFDASLISKLGKPAAGPEFPVTGSCPNMSRDGSEVAEGLK